MVAGLLVAFLVYWFWWRKRHPAIALRRSPIPSPAGLQSPNTPGSGKVRFGADAKASGPAPRRSRFLSRQLGMEEKGELAGQIAEAQAREYEEGAGEKTPTLDNPFADSDGTSLAEMDGHESVSSRPRPNSTTSSDFSFRSSHSTQNIPIAYIPAHSASISIADGMQRGPLGERRQSSLSQKRLTVSNLPKVNADGSLQNVPNPLVSSPTGSLTSSSKSKAAAPSRPDRQPGMDLRLPKVAPTITTSFGVPEAPDTGLAGSHFSTSTMDTSAEHLSSYYASGSPSFLSAPPLPNRTLSTISASSDNSHMSMISHMSYILDPPQVWSIYNNEPVTDFSFNNL